MLRSLLPWEKVAEGRMRAAELPGHPFAGRQWKVLPSSVRFADSFSPKGEAFQRLRVSLRSGLTHFPFSGVPGHSRISQTAGSAKAATRWSKADL